TRRQLERGQRLMEVIKQGAQEPLSVINQIVIIYAGTNGYLDHLPVNQIREYERQLMLALDSRYAAFVDKLTGTLAMTDDIKTELNRILTEFKDVFDAPGSADA
ncbi:MAG: F0F1 ATP synthase subunit alpha, partial [Verrucomicrobia bacterium]|nr:F0F1 ATP synthase subunit alpha [Verrucomicrobiota bacterium]